MRTSVAKIWIKLESLFVYLDPEEHEINFVHYFLHPACVMDHPSCACQSATMAMRGCSWAEVVFLTCTNETACTAACASESDSITLAGPVSPRTLNAACLRVKVESITILTESPALNWPCAVFASRRYNVIRYHGRDWRWQHARTHARELPPTHGSPGAVRGQESGAALGSTTDECSGLWLAKYKQIASQSPGWSRLNKYSKISNRCVSFESNQIASNYSIRFEISNICTALHMIHPVLNELAQMMWPQPM